ncbi:MAG TPA: hypothetical protein VHZ77_10480 [Gaiellaceae bacterium]|nr:hypothetical protein [Gaiellaceae bacterium]
MKSDELLEQVAVLDPARAFDVPDPDSDEAQSLLARAMMDAPKMPHRASLPLVRRPALLVASVFAVAAVGALVSPPGQGAVRAAVDQVSSWFSGQATVVGTNGGEPIAQLKTDGIVTSAVSDGQGGWYIAGGFTEVNGEPRAHLAHILGDGSVDPNWTPQLGGDAKPNYIYATLSSANGRLFVAGTFTTVDGQALGNVVALDAQTGDVAQGWEGNFNALGEGNFALATDGEHIYVGVTGTAIVDGQVRNCLVALDAQTGQLDSEFSPDLKAPGDLVCVSSLALSDGTLFASGTFAQSTNATRATVVALNATTGATVPRFVSPTLSPDQAVPLALAASADALYVGGNFDATDGSQHQGIVALDPQTGTPLQSFDDTVTTNSGDTGAVFSLLLVGDRLYLGGQFDSVAGESRDGFAVLDVANGQPLSAGAVPGNDYVLSLALSGQGVMAAGKGGGG